VTGPPAGGVLDITAQRDLVSQAHRQGITDLLVLAFIPDGRRLALFECESEDGERQWTVPFTAVLPGELIEDALDRLCCQLLRVNPDRTEFLSATTTVRQGSEVVQYAFEVALDQPRILDDATTPGRPHWWSAEDPNTLPIATGVRPLLEAFYGLVREAGEPHYETL
jgi:ADP-ribose pyrophosphatase YjhB (NUDIX family)